jgi:hypothetical protein
MEFFGRVSHILKLDAFFPADPEPVKKKKDNGPRTDWRPTPALTSNPIGHTAFLSMNPTFTEPFHVWKKPQILLIYGKTQGGKSTMARSYIKTMQEDDYFQSGLVITTTKYNKDWSCFPKKDVWDANDPKIEEYVIKYLQMCDAQADKHQGNVPPTVVIFDDTTDLLGNFEANKVFKNMITKHHHLNMTMIFITHRYSGTCTLFRENAHLVFVYQANTRSHFTHVFDDFGLHLPAPYDDKNGWKQLVRTVCMRNQCILFDKDRDQPMNYCLKCPNVTKTSFRAFHTEPKPKKPKEP